MTKQRRARGSGGNAFEMMDQEECLIIDSYENKVLLGAMIRDATKAAIHNNPDLQRLNNILVCEAFVTALVDKGCMITRIPSHD